MFIIHRLKSWSDQTSRIKTHLFIKNEILFGREKSCDIRQDEIPSISHRLNFQSRELHDLQNQVVQSLQDQELFQIGSTVYMLAQPPQLRVPVKYILTFSLIVVAITIFSFVPREESMKCTPTEKMTASGRWSYKGGDKEVKDYFDKLILGRKLFKSALQQGDLLMASSALQNLKTTAAYNEACSTHAALEDLERKLMEKRILKLIKEDQSILAAELIGKNHGFDLLEERIIKNAKRMLWESWKLEIKNPEQSFQLKKTIKEICEKLGRLESCLDTGLEAPPQVLAK